MSAYPPPTEDLAIFNVNNYKYTDTTALTYATALEHFLKFPTAQGTENFLDANVANQLTVGGLIEFGDGSIQTTAHVGDVGIIPTLYAYSSTSAGNAPILNLNFSGASWTINDFFTIELHIQCQYENNTYASFDGLIDIYPYRVPTNPTTPIMPSGIIGTVANINNEIYGDNSYIYTNPTYAPDGRYYYSHGFTLKGLNDKIYLTSNNQSQIGIFINNSATPQILKVGISLKIINVGANSSPITVTGLTSFDNYNSANF